MQRIHTTDPSEAKGKALQQLTAIEQQLGTVPNIFKTFANSPAVLDFYLSQSQALAKGALSAKLREQIAVAVAGENSCDYCASAHTAIGKQLGLTEDELRDNLQGLSTDQKTKAALDFARRIVATRGQVTDNDLSVVREAGYTEGEIVEIIANVGMNLFTNYFNHIADTDVDFPLVNTRGLDSAA